VCELTDLGVGEWDRELDGVRRVDIDGGSVWWGVSLHTTDDLLVVIAIVDIRCYHLFVCVVVARDIEGVET